MAGTTTLSSAVRTNLLSLQSTANALAKTQERLATGLKVNSALDDPTAFFTASSLNSRANDLSRLQDFVGNSVQTLKAADEGIQAITKLVESAEATARQALNSAGTTASSTGTLDTTATTSFDFASTATATGNVDLDGAGAFDFAATNTGTGVTVNATNFDDFEATTTGSNVAGLSGSVDIVGDTAVTAGQTLTIDLDGGGASTITLGAGNVNTEAALISAIDGIVGAGATSIDGSGAITITTQNGEDLTLGGTGLANLGLTAGPFVAENTLGISNGDTFTVDAGSGSPTTITFGTGAGEVNTLAEFDAALEAVDGVTASVDGSNNLVIATTNGEDLALAAGTGTPLTELGITAGTTTASNSFGIENGDTFTVQVGAAAAQTVTFGADGGSGEVNTLAELEAALDGFTDVTASVDGTTGFLSITADGGDLTIAEGTNTPLADLGLTAGATTADTTATSGIAYGDSFSVQVGSAAATTITFGSSTGQVDTGDELLAALNAIDNVSATVTDDGFLKVEATNGEDLTIAEGTNTPAATLGLSVATTEAAANTERAAFATQFNELRSQIDQLAADASYNGNNLLAGDSLSVSFNEDSSSTLTVTGVNFNSNGLGIDTAVDTFQKDSDINAALADLTTATSSLRAQSSKFGSNLSVVETRQDFTKNLINVLETGAANLTLADTNEEGANLLALQTRQQLSSTSLSLASQADQNVLRLF